MSNQSLRFLCAGGFQLHAVLGGISDAPEHLLDVLTNATYRATEQVFQTALREEVDFVLLTGDLLDAASGGPRAVAFLRKQFELLHDNGIPAFWSASRMDLSNDWLQHVELPPNIHRFAEDAVEAKPVVVNDDLAAVILGRSWSAQRPLRAAEYSAGSTNARHVALLYCPCELEGLPSRIGFWATGGTSEATTSHLGKQVVHGPGWPQGLLPHHTGPHGCTLVHIDSAGDARLRPIEAQAVRWAQERVLVPDGASLSDVRSALRLRAQKLLSESDRPGLIGWMLAGDGWFNSPLVHPHRRVEVLEWLRGEFGMGSPWAWSLGLETEPPERLRDEWTDEDSILGDYLRITREYLEDEAKSLVLERPRSARDLPDELQAALPVEEPAVRFRVLREAAVLGVGLLRGDDRSAEAAALPGRDS
jgi:hypothetical protein